MLQTDKGHETHRQSRTASQQLIVTISTQCHYCGYETDEFNPGICPKCHGSIWERFAHPRPRRAKSQGHSASHPIQ